MVVDEPPTPTWLTDILLYATGSQQCIERTRKRQFESILFRNQSELDKWRAIIGPDPDGASRHVRRLKCAHINTLEGFEEHIRGFARVKALAFRGCDLLLSPSVVESFAPMGSNLLKLKIDRGSTTYSIISSLLAALPRLRHLRARFLEFRSDRDVTGPPYKIPFFEGAGCLDLLIEKDDHESLDWIPPSARFRDLRINVPSILNKSGRVKQWIASSAECLKFLSITPYTTDANFTPLDLSGCTALESLQLKIGVPQPGAIADVVLPSLYSFPPPKIVLVMTGSCAVQVDFRAWEVMGRHLCRAAKEFKTAHPGKKMEVEVSVGGWVNNFKPAFVEWCKSGEIMLKLMEDANVVVTDGRIR